MVLKNAFPESFSPRAKLNDKDKIKSNQKKKPQKILKIDNSKQSGLEGERELFVLSLSQLNVGFPPSRDPNHLPSSGCAFFSGLWESGLSADSPSDYHTPSESTDVL